MRTAFLTSAADVHGFPLHQIPEVAFAGRSNVGKSALLNALAGARLARTSRTPGRTQLVNFFTVDRGVRRYALADLPGYGYARAPKVVQQSWAPLAESYLESRGVLRMVLLLVDVRRGVQPDDRALIAFMDEVLAPRGVIVEAVGTKLDKIPKAKRKPALYAIAAALDLPRGGIHATSALKREGLETLRDRVESVLFGEEPPITGGSPPVRSRFRRT